MDLILLIAIQAGIFAMFSHLVVALVTFSCVSLYSSMLAAFFGPLTKAERAMYIGIPTLVSILIPPMFAASQRFR